MPGNGLSFAIRVRCQINVPAMVCFLLECLDNVFLVLGIDVFRLEIIIDINAKCLLRQISQMTFRSKDLVIRSENFSLLFCFSRRFYDNKMLSLGFGLRLKDGSAGAFVLVLRLLPIVIVLVIGKIFLHLLNKVQVLSSFRSMNKNDT